ncbi:MAG: hypothetical protein ACXW3S_17215 [Rhodoplanes sp.]
MAAGSAEPTERDIDRAAADRPLKCNRIGTVSVEGRETENFAQHLLEKQVPDGGFLLPREFGALGGFLA